MVPLQLYIAVIVATLATALPSPGKGKKWELCQKYDLLYRQCLPPSDWICDESQVPETYVSFNIRKAMDLSDGGFVNYLRHSRECNGVSKHVFSKQDNLEDIRGTGMTKMARVHKFPMCREVKTLVTHVYRPFYDAMTDVKTGSEICEVVLSGVAQIVFKVECVGHKKTSQCRFHYAPQEDYYCRPTNYVTRTMVILCPSDNGILTYHVEKIPTACSCVKVGCDDMFTTKKLL
ncbi:Hypothetical predicted protein [Mytilus galloprovincialis]|uniref:Spaetzle domain-containing protein n=2 Tax=Mytilus galloprovincialis TaxID=29158 RepID=A0A8B6BKV9_MYTGA|nr:Hypothetical predicted protein [Mytilus galloprovincialis]